MCDLFKDGYCGNTLTEKQLEDLEEIIPKNKLKITGKNTATYYQEIYEMGVEDTVIIEEDDGYPD
jgi:hypothetical protein